MITNPKRMNIDYIPSGRNAKSAILFSILVTILSCPRFRKAPELVRTLYAA